MRVETSSETLIAEAMRAKHGATHARRWLASQCTPRSSSQPSFLKPTATSSTESPINAPVNPSPQAFQKSSEGPREDLPVHPSHQAATELLAPYKEDLGAAYPTLHAIARCSIEYASADDPAPHLLTTQWTLEEMTGQSTRNLRRHLIEGHHAWSETVQRLIDLRTNYGTFRQGPHEKPTNVGTLIRFFPQGRYSPNAKIKKFAHRDLIAESEAGRTCFSRPGLQRARYERVEGQMSAYSSVMEQTQALNWVMLHVGRSVPGASLEQEDSARLYEDIPRKHLLNALRADLQLGIEQAEERGASVGRARALWVDKAGRILSARFHDDRAPLQYTDMLPEGQQAAPGVPIGYTVRSGQIQPVYADGFRRLWWKLLWTAIRAELYGGTMQGWILLERMLMHAEEAQLMGKRKPIAWAWTLIKQEGFAELLRDFGNRVGVYS